MEHTGHEPQSSVARLRPCSTPHSAPVGWLKTEPAPARETAEPDIAEPTLTDENIDQLVAALSRDPKALAEVVSRACPEGNRHDGWTPFYRRLFLEVLAETGRVSLACEYCQLTPQSAYKLRARDPLFAAGWDAACEIARAPLADALYEKAMDGVTETVTRDGEVVAERHRFDSRLSIAVLHRLDKRCDRAAELESNHVAVVRNWEEWIRHVGRGEDEAAQAILDSAQHHQLHQLPLGENPTEEEEQVREIDLSERCWESDDGWMTDFPPPPGFTGWERGKWGDYNYERVCTPEEIAALEANEAAAIASERAEEDHLRDAWFAMLRAENEEGGDRCLAGTPEQQGALAPTSPPADPV